MSSRPPLSFAVALSSGLGAGFAPKGPGTVGTVVVCGLWVALFSVAPYSLALHLVLLGLLTLVGLWSIRKTLAEMGADPGVKDPQFIVIDEWIGFLVAALAASPHSFWETFSAFLLFRLFDILKPGPVRWAESFAGEWGILADDVAAGIAALVAFALGYALFQATL